jgi:predicted N-acyltransferase
VSAGEETPAEVPIVVEMGEGVSQVDREAWNALVGEGSPFLEWDWLASLEEAGCTGPETGWQPRPLLAHQGERLVAACPLYVKGNSEGEFVFDWGWADAAHRAGIEYYPKLLVGVPFTPVTGSRFLTAPDVDRQACIAVLGDALRKIVADNELSSVHVNFCEEDEVSVLEARGYQLRMGFQYHWHNDGYSDFDAYLQGLRAKRRNQVKRERRRVVEQDVVTEALCGDAIPDDVFDPMFDCYLATVDAHYYGRRYLNRAFFELLRQRFKERLCFIVARRDGEIVAGTTNVQKGNALYGRYWGALEDVRFLHFDVCYYAAIEHCIAEGLDRFEPGAGGDYKFLRGFDARPTYSLHHVADPGFAAAIGRFLSQERAHAGEVMEHLDRQSAVKATRDRP